MARTTLTPAEYAAKRGNGLHKWVDAKTASGALQVLTDATLYHDLEEGEVVMIKNMSFILESVSDDCTFEVVSCAGAAGTGDATQLCAKRHMYTASARDELASQQVDFVPPIRVAYADGALSISGRINANDSSAVISIGWMGYRDETYP